MLRRCKSPKFILLFTGIIIIVIALLSWLYISGHDRRLRVQVLEVYFPDLPEELEGLKLVMLSDLHFRATEFPELKRLISVLNSYNPDLVLLLGDYAVGHTPDELLKKGCEILGTLRSRDGIYSVCGNHDWGFDNVNVVKYLQEAGIKTLCTERWQIPLSDRGTVELVGAEWGEIVCEIPQDEQWRLFLLHDPMAFDKTRPGFFVAGHTHGGQVRLPLLGSLYWKHWLTDQPERWFSTPEGAKGQLFVSAGFGSNVSGMRFFDPPEAAVATLHRGNPQLNRQTERIIE